MKYWKTLIVIIFILLAIFLEWNWVWALFLSYNLWVMFQQKEINIVEPIHVEEAPVIYWLVFFLLAIIDIYLILSYLNFL